MSRVGRKELKATQVYQGFSRIDGTHPLQDKVPFSFVPYQVRQRSGGKLAFFNFTLAKDMGLIEPDHAHEINPSLAEVLLQTFGLIIVNEYDLERPGRIDPSSIRSQAYMATRYLQMQHPDRRGLSSGDGRSIWNGIWTHKNRSWDLSSCGTGATCLSPASSRTQTFFRSGDPSVSYGCGYSKLQEGIIDVVFSEILARNDVKTERILCIIEFPKGYAVTVRVAENLLRPSHFFIHLKQSRLDRLRAMVDYYIERQLNNGSWQIGPQEQPYTYFLEAMVKNFAQAAARFESDYIFCWMEWDGDNILADAGIIDYGSIRQFGLCFHEYRFDDVERWSTNLKEQRRKARYLVQTFAQMIDYLQKGRKRSIENFAQCAAVKKFDRIFLRTRRLLLLRKMGFTEVLSEQLMQKYHGLIGKFENVFMRLEYAKNHDGDFRVPDGRNQHVLFVMRRLLRLIPLYLQNNDSRLDARNLLGEVLAETYHDHEAVIKSCHIKQLNGLLQLYNKILHKVLREGTLDRAEVLSQLTHRTSILNRDDRITGDAVCMLAEQLMEQRRRLNSRQFHKLIELIVRDQTLNPDFKGSPYLVQLRSESSLQLQLKRALKTLRAYREGL